MDGAVTEIYGIESVCLCKKNIYIYIYTYIHILESTDKDCNTINSEHTRCRGIPTSCIKYKASQDKITVLGIYENMYTGEVFEFD